MNDEGIYNQPTISIGIFQALKVQMLIMLSLFVRKQKKNSQLLQSSFFLSIMIGQLTLKSFHDFAFVSANETEMIQK